MSVREALNMAMEEEMLRDEKSVTALMNDDDVMTFDFP